MLEFALGALEPTGLAPAACLETFSLINGFIANFARAELANSAAASAAEADPGQAARTGRPAAGTAGHRAVPEVRRPDHDRRSAAAIDLTAQFDPLLDRILDGLIAVGRPGYLSRPWLDWPLAWWEANPRKFFFLKGVVGVSHMGRLMRSEEVRRGDTKAARRGQRWNPGSTISRTRLPRRSSSISARSGRLLADSGLPGATQELVKIRASQINGCAGCLDMHTKDAAEAGESQLRLNLVAAWREANVFTEAERAALELTEQGTRIADGAGGVSDEVWDNAAKYFDEDQLATLVCVIAVINTFNRLNVITRQVGGDYQPGQWG